MISAYLAVVGLAAAVQFLAFPFYAYDSAGDRLDWPVTVWLVPPPWWSQPESDFVRMGPPPFRPSERNPA